MATVDANMLTSEGECNYLHKLSVEMSSFYSKPDKYLEPTDNMRKEILALSKKMYDFMKEFEIYSSNQNSLNELLVSGFDNEQIWQEIQLQNSPCLPRFSSSLKGLNVENVYLSERKDKIVGKQKKKQIEKSKNTKHISIETQDLFENEGFREGDESMEEEDENEIIQPSRKKYKQTVVDDDFFRLREMEEFLDKQDKLEEIKNNENADDGDDENNKGDSEIDIFKEGSSDEEESVSFDTLQYNDFFDPPATLSNTKSKKDDDNDDDDDGDDEMKDEAIEDDEDDEDNEDNEEDENEEEEEVVNEEEDDIGEDIDVDSDNDIEFDIEQQEGDGNKVEQSTFERKQKQMQEKIKKLEEENLSEKPWQLMGEAVAKKRPVNSLLEEFLTFDHTSVGAPAVTEETTLSLEDLIKQRIKDQAWDDVLRKEKLVVQPFEYKKAPELNQEKSKLSLAEVYEKEYLKQAEDDKEEKENEEHVNIGNLIDRLFVQLDALSNFHFTPKPPQPEIKIITNAPSLQIEEVLPITMTEASQLAPEEVFEKKKGELLGTEEKNDEDRKRERRQKKIKKKFAVKAKEKKEKLKAQKAGKVAKSERKQAIDSLKKGVRNTIVNDNRTVEKNVKSSNDFFNKLQNEVKKNISKESLKGKKVAVKAKKSAEFLKL